MGKDSKITWTDHSFNPWVGCQKVSQGCANCYAERDMTRKPRWANAWGPPETSERVRTKTWHGPIRWNRQARVQKNPQKVFCGSLCDVFENNPQVGDWRIELFEDVIRNTPWLQWLILTKRPERALEFFENRPELLTANVWMGISAADQETANERIPYLAQVPARTRFLSLEPLLGPIKLGFMETAPQTWTVNRNYQPVWSFIHWVSVGGESGPNARPMHLDWVRSIKDQCQEADVPFFFKQWGEYAPNGDRVGRKQSGHLLDGKEWYEFPKVME